MNFSKTFKIATVVSALALMLGPGCQYLQKRGAQAQGWTAQERSDWYWASQGSRLMPLSWFKALEQAQTRKKFSEVDYLTTFGFLPPPQVSGEDRPIGFTHDTQDDANFEVTGLRWYEGQTGGENSEHWMGLNCSACHTALITYEGTPHLVDGGPSLLDFQLFIEAVDASLEATHEDPQKFARFAGLVLDGKDTEDNRAMLKEALSKHIKWQEKTDKMNETGMRYGFGRLDAVGHILNKILMFNGAGEKEGNEANAPVSYPFIWDIWRQERVQWNGVALNSRIPLPGDPVEYGAAGRNAGEVLGVFGEVIVDPDPGFLKGYKSSVNVKNLMRLERILKDLEAPAWPSDFPTPDQALVDQGKELFKEHCVDCHLTPDRQEPNGPTEKMISFTEMQEDGGKNLTDIWMACNAFIYEGPTGPMEGTKDNEGKVMGDVEPVANMLGVAVKNSLIGRKEELIGEAVNNFFGIRGRPDVELALDPFDPRANDRNTCLSTKDVIILGYKARPLDGIWATAPFLHNGSVPTLYDLLLPASERPKSFWVGSREFDPVNVGYSTEKPAIGGFELKTHGPSGRVIEGNSNKGHEYGADALSEEQRRALVEYMKTL